MAHLSRIYCHSTTIQIMNSISTILTSNANFVNPYFYRINHRNGHVTFSKLLQHPKVDTASSETTQVSCCCQDGCTDVDDSPAGCDVGTDSSDDGKVDGSLLRRP